MNPSMMQQNRLSGAGEARRQSQFSEAHDRMESQLERLALMLERLESRLEPAMVPAPPATAEKNPLSPSTLCKMVEVYAGQAMRVSFACDRIAALLDRLELP